MKNRILYIAFAVIFLMGNLLPNGIQGVSAQPSEQEVPNDEFIQREPCMAGKPCQDENGHWYVAEEQKSLEVAENATRAIGDTDEYGYTLSHTTYSWIDASSGGTNTGLTSDHDQTSAINLSFNFPFYGNTYSEVFITGSGYLTFSDQWVRSQSQMPHPDEPNNVIAPYWSPFYDMGEVFYKVGGSEPNRWFLVEYNQLSDIWGGSFTFEVQLFENGDIKFQYKEMETSDSWMCAEAGIEDVWGEDGLTLSVWCGNYPASKTAVMFTYPDPMARVRVTPLYQGEFTYSGEVDEFIFTVDNTGDLGPDTYNMDVNIAPGGTLWTATLHDADTGDPLADTDGDGKVDTGSIPQGESRDVLAKVTAPTGLSAGNAIKTLVDVTSSNNPLKTKMVTLESTVPAAFTQAYVNYSDGQLINELNWSTTQIEADVKQNWGAENPAVVETPNHQFVNVWRKWDQGENGEYGYTLNYAVIDRFGQVIHPATALTTLYGEEDSYTVDVNLSLAVTPDGKVGLFWTRYIRNASDQHNYNAWFAVLNSDGSLAYGPVNLSNNNQWGSYEQGFVYFAYTKIEASSDNRFMLAWTKYNSRGAGNDTDIYTMIRHSNGTPLTGLINMTDDVEDAYGYYNLSLTALSENRFYVFYVKEIWENDRWYSFPKYRVFDSSGGQIIGESDADFYSVRDSTQLPGGNIIFVYQEYDWNSQISNAVYTILNSSTFSVITSGTLSHPSSSGYYGSTSVTKTPDGKAIITWSDQKYLYYALLHSGGTVLSGPVIFNRFEDGASINTDGYAITTNSWQPAAGVDTLVEFPAPLYGGAPGGLAGVQISYANHGLATAKNVQMTLTLDAELNYSHDSSGITPTIIDDTITWDLPDLAFADQYRFSVYVSVPTDAVVGTFYDISLAIEADGVDIDPSNNTDSCQVMAAELLFLPLLMR